MGLGHRSSKSQDSKETLLGRVEPVSKPEGCGLLGCTAETLKPFPVLLLCCLRSASMVGFHFCVAWPACAVQLNEPRQP